MGNFFCPDVTHLATVARDFCPFPDYSPSPLLNILSVNSSLQLSEHYAAVQGSLTPQQRQDFTQTLRRTFGREGKVSYGGVGIVALSLAVLFDTVAKQVKEEYVSDREPIPGLFLKNPTGDYPTPVYTVSKYLRLVPHIANNPARMRDETEKYLHELKQGYTQTVNEVHTTLKYESITAFNMMSCLMIGKNMLLHLERLSNKTIDEQEFLPENEGPLIFHRPLIDPKPVLNLNCDPSVASQTFYSALDSLDSRAQEEFKKCTLLSATQSVDKLAFDDWLITQMLMFNTWPEERGKMLVQTEEFDLKANALGGWV